MGFGCSVEGRERKEQRKKGHCAKHLASIGERELGRYTDFHEEQNITFENINKVFGPYPKHVHEE